MQFPFLIFSLERRKKSELEHEEKDPAKYLYSRRITIIVMQRFSESVSLLEREEEEKGAIIWEKLLNKDSDERYTYR